MKIILQRVSSADVLIDGCEKRGIGGGLLVLLGICGGDTEGISSFMAEKTANLRIFDDADENMNLSLLDIGGDALVISNFTLYANSRKGRRPSFIEAARPETALPLYENFARALEFAGVKRVETGEFGAHMDVSLTNDGPVTIILDSEEIMPAGYGAAKG
ncbi:MAG: D-aminoacyl-tRNA deacylase [Oscillospiraceae bacterium]|nr:D-aminoacyl-tRNA deacylase [Oscillospiraceae bacterium]